YRSGARLSAVPGDVRLAGRGRAGEARRLRRRRRGRRPGRRAPTLRRDQPSKCATGTAATRLGLSLAARAGDRRAWALPGPGGARAAPEDGGRARRIVRTAVMHISVCICTYRRPALLARLLEALEGQDTGGAFTYSIVVCDNDAARSSEPVVSAFSRSSRLEVQYCVE